MVIPATSEIQDLSGSDPDYLAEIRVVVEQREEFVAVFVREENLLSVISTLGDVQWVVGGSEAESTGHLTK